MSIVQLGAVGKRPAETDRGDGVDRSQQFAEIAGRWEVLVLIGDSNLLDSVGWSEEVDDCLNDVFGC